jgi:hypothetical protein
MGPKVSNQAEAELAHALREKPANKTVPETNCQIEIELLAFESQVPMIV